MNVRLKNKVCLSARPSNQKWGKKMHWRMFGMTHLRRPNKMLFLSIFLLFFPQSYLLFGLRLSWVAISPRGKYFTTSLPSTSLQLHTGPRSQEHCGPGEAYFISFVNILQETIYKATTWSPLLNVWRSSVIDKCGGWRGKKTNQNITQAFAALGPWSPAVGRRDKLREHRRDILTCRSSGEEKTGWSSAGQCGRDILFCFFLFKTSKALALRTTPNTPQ